MVVLRKDKTVVAIYEGGSHCSKVFTTEIKAKDMVTFLKENNLSLDELISRDKEEYDTLYKFHLAQPRYQDKRRVEKLLRDYKEQQGLPIPKKPKTKKVNELLIPVSGGERSVYWVRESNIYKEKWINLMGGRKKMEAHVEKFKKSR